MFFEGQSRRDGLRALSQELLYRGARHQSAMNFQFKMMNFDLK